MRHGFSITFAALLFALGPLALGRALAQSTRVEQTWSERIVVTATRTDQPAGEVPLHITVLPREEIVASPQLGIQDLLQQFPSIVFFEGSSSLVSVPRDQSIGFRGLGGIAQSRSLVLLDGLPINDPYGSYIPWNMIPKETLERVEIVPGSAGIWGNLALSGVVNLITRDVGDHRLSAAGNAGDRSTRDVVTSWSDVGEAWSGSVSGNYLETGGYFMLPDEERGAIDEPRRKEFYSLAGRLGRAINDGFALGLGGRIYTEERHEGTPYEGSTSRWRGVDARVDLVGDEGRAWQVHFFGRRLTPDQQIGEPTEDRNQEIPGSDIDIPADSAGLGALWTSAAGSHHELTAGGDLQYVSIERAEDFQFLVDRYTLHSFTEGRQQVAGVFAQDVFEPSPRWHLTASGRFDSIRTYDGHLLESDLLTGTTREETLLDDNTETTFNPSLGAVFAATEAVHVRAAAYTGFRAPTPSELFVALSGTNETAANPALEPERLIGGELGVDLTPSRRFSARVTGFFNRVEDLIERVEVGRAGSQGGSIEPCGFVAPRGRCRQRRNLGQVETRGLELSSELRPATHWRLTLSAPLLETEITENAANPALIGNRLARTADESATLGVHYDNPRLFHVYARGLYVGDRFDDNANADPLPSYAVMDLGVSRALGASWDVLAGVTNVFDREYTVVLTSDLHELGAPRLFHVGFRFNTR